MLGGIHVNINVSASTGISQVEMHSDTTDTCKLVTYLQVSYVAQYSRPSKTEKLQVYSDTDTCRLSESLPRHHDVKYTDKSYLNPITPGPRAPGLSFGIRVLHIPRQNGGTR